MIGLPRYMLGCRTERERENKKERKKDVPRMQRPTGLDDNIEQRENNLKNIDSRSNATSI